VARHPNDLDIRGFLKEWFLILHVSHFEVPYRQIPQDKLPWRGTSLLYIIKLSAVTLTVDFSFKGNIQRNMQAEGGIGIWGRADSPRKLKQCKMPKSAVHQTILHDHTSGIGPIINDRGSQVLRNESVYIYIYAY